MQNQRNELQRVLEANVTFPNEEFMRELWQNGVESANDLAYLQPRIADNLCAVSGVAILVLHNPLE